MAPELRARRKHILIVGGIVRSLINFRGPLIRELLSRGHRVTATAAGSDPEAVAELATWGVPFFELPLKRSRLNPLSEARFVASLAGLMRRTKPDVFFGYTIKPVVNGLIAASVMRVPRRVAMIEGLGYSFTDGDEARRRIARRMVTLAFRASLPLADELIVHNHDDERFFQQHGLRRIVCLPGMGIDLDHFSPAMLPGGPPTFLMLSRLLRDKGVREFAEAARIVKARRQDVRFILLGPTDDNPASVPLSDVEEWVKEGLLDYRGAVADVRPVIAAAHVLVLPTWYREGMPRTILEAMAVGRPVVTTDVPGCRETIVDGESGILVPPRDVPALSGAIMKFAADRDLIVRSGAAALRLCRERFDARIVVPRTAEIILGESAAAWA